MEILYHSAKKYHSPTYVNYFKKGNKNKWIKLPI